MFFEPNSPDACCLCGSQEDLTGEHKIKASAIRSVFGQDGMAITRVGETAYRLAQSAKSSRFHFDTKLCRECNSANTQQADKAFALFHDRAIEMISQDRPPLDVFELDEFEKHSEKYVSLFRYFAKLLACHIADAGGPRPISLVDFAVGESDRNVVKLAIDFDSVYKTYNELTSDTRYAAHGGLTIWFSKSKGLAHRFSSSLTIGPIRYEFFLDFEPFVAEELKEDFPAFYKASEDAIQRSPERPEV